MEMGWWSNTGRKNCLRISGLGSINLGRLRRSMLGAIVLRLMGFIRTPALSTRIHIWICISPCILLCRIWGCRVWECREWECRTWGLIGFQGWWWWIESSTNNNNSSSGHPTSTVTTTRSNNPNNSQTSQPEDCPSSSVKQYSRKRKNTTKMSMHTDSSILEKPSKLTTTPSKRLKKTSKSWQTRVKISQEISPKTRRVGEAKKAKQAKISPRKAHRKIPTLPRPRIRPNLMMRISLP